MSMATMMSMEATSAGARNVVSMRFSNNAPAIAAGMVAAIMYHSKCRSRRCSSRAKSRTLSLGSEKRTTLSAEGCAQDLDPGAPKVKQDGEKCARVQRHVKGEAGIAPVR